MKQKKPSHVINNPIHTASYRLILFSAFFVLFFAVFLYNFQAKASAPVYFTLQQDHVHFEMARIGLADILEESESQIGREVPLGLARADLNDDGIQELFVRLLDQELFCEGEDCDTYVFAIVGSDLAKIGQFRTRTIDILDTKTDGARDMRLTLQDGSQKIVRWDEATYQMAEHIPSPHMNADTDTATELDDGGSP